MLGDLIYIFPNGDKIDIGEKPSSENIFLF